MTAKNWNFGKVKSVDLTVAMILGAIGGSMLLSGNASAAPATSNAIAATHLSWNGYNGNETIYMTKGVQNESYYLPEKNSTMYQSGDSNQANVSNQIALDFGAKLYAPSGLKPTFETYSNTFGDLEVYYGVTIATATNQSSWYDKITQGSSVTTTTEEIVSSYVNATGFSGVNSGVDGDTVGSDYAASLNDSLTALSGLNNTLGLSLLMGAISAIPYLGYFTIPVALSLTQFVNETNSPSASFDGLNTAQTVGFYVKQYTGYYDKWLNNSGYQNDYNYAWGKNLMSFSVGSYIDINQTDFGGSGVLVVNAMNMLGNYGGGGVSTPYPGASKSLQIPIVPSNTITGKVENNNVSASNQEIVLTQTNLNNTVTQYYEKTDANGNYRFFAEPNRTYEIQAVTPGGLSAGNVVTVANDENNTTLNLNLNIPGTMVFSETGLPPGTSWSVIFNGQTIQSASNSISFSEPYGTYSYSIGGVGGYVSSPQSGSITVNDITQSQAIGFYQPATVTFTESGLPSGASWSANVGGYTGSSSGSSLTISGLSTGSYSWSLPNVDIKQSNGDTDVYSASPSSGSVTVSSGTTESFSTTFSLSSVQSPPSGGGGGGGGSTGCVNGTTQILLANGTYMQAQDLNIVGSYVMTYNLTTHSYHAEEVKDLYITHLHRQYDINGILNVSAYQPILTNHGYVTAQNLTTKDKMYNAVTRSFVQITGITVYHGYFTMYDFNIPPDYDFIAGHFVVYDATIQP